MPTFSNSFKQVRQLMTEPTTTRPLRMCLCLSWRRSLRSEEHTSELQSLMRISYAVFCLKKKITNETSISAQPPINITKQELDSHLKSLTISHQPPHHLIS